MNNMRFTVKKNSSTQFNNDSYKQVNEIVRQGINEKYEELPFVSVCTPTFNRRPFIPFIIECFKQQDYPKEKMEWIIVDDGDDKIGDLVKNIPQVKYFTSDKKLALGKKRNLMNQKCKGEIIVYMDDDDYYPPCRVSHVVETLENNTLYDVVGCDNISVYFNEPENKTYRIGPYHEYYTTAATLAFRKCYLTEHKFNENCFFAEESSFLNNFTEPLIKLDPDKTIVVFSHSLNIIDKRFTFKNPEHHNLKVLDKDITEIITNQKCRHFVLNNDNYVKDYKYGKTEFNQDMMEKLEKFEKENNSRLKIIEGLKEKLNKHTKDELIDILLNLKVRTIYGYKNNEKD